jgi:hypothetical protein
LAGLLREDRSLSRRFAAAQSTSRVRTSPSRERAPAFTTWRAAVISLVGARSNQENPSTGSLKPAWGRQGPV